MVATNTTWSAISERIHGTPYAWKAPTLNIYGWLVCETYTLKGRLEHTLLPKWYAPSFLHQANAFNPLRYVF